MRAEEEAKNNNDAAQTALNDAKNDLANAQTALDQANADLASKKQAYEDAQKILNEISDAKAALDKAVTEEETAKKAYEDAKLAYQKAQANVDALAEKVTEAETALENAKAKMKLAYSLTGKSSETLTDEEIEKYGLAEFADELQIAMQNLADAKKAYEDAVTESNAKKSVLDQTNTAYAEKKKAYDSATAAYNAYKKAEEDKKKEDEKKPATSEVIVADKKNTSKTAKTADESNIGLNAYMMVGSLTIAGVVVFAIRKKRMSE